MKKLWLLALVLSSLTVVCSTSVASAEENFSGDDWKGRYNELSQEFDKQKELLDIWKDHVREVTKERDQAYKEMETLKLQRQSGPSMGTILRKGEIETQAIGGAMVSQSMLQDLQKNYDQQQKQFNAILKEKEMSDKRVKELTGKLDTLQSQNASIAKKQSPKIEETSSGELQSLRAENKLLQVQAEKLSLVETELTETKNYYSSEIKRTQQENKKLNASHETLLKERNSALDQAENLKTQLAAIQSELDKIKGLESQVAELRMQKNTLQKEKINLEKQYNESQEIIKTIDEKFNNLQADYADITKENLRLRASQDAMKASLQAVSQDLAKVKNSFDSSFGSLTSDTN